MPLEAQMPFEDEFFFPVDQKTQHCLALAVSLLEAPARACSFRNQRHRRSRATRQNRGETIFHQERRESQTRRERLAALLQEHRSNQVLLKRLPAPFPDART